MYYNSLKLHKIQYYYFHFKDKYPVIQETMNDTRATENKGQHLPRAYIYNIFLLPGRSILSFHLAFEFAQNLALLTYLITSIHHESQALFGQECFFITSPPLLLPPRHLVLLPTFIKSNNHKVQVLEVQRWMRQCSYAEGARSPQEEEMNYYTTVQ